MMEELLKKIEEELYQYCSIKYKDDSTYIVKDSFDIKTPTYNVKFEIACPLKNVTKTYSEIKKYFIAEIGIYAMPELVDPKLFYMLEIRIYRVQIDKRSKKLCYIEEIYPHHGPCRIKDILMNINDILQISSKEIEKIHTKLNFINISNI